MDDLKEKIRSAISLWALNGSEFPDELAEEIMLLVNEHVSEVVNYELRDAE